jgi:hypothetical protein
MPRSQPNQQANNGTVLLILVLLVAWFFLQGPGSKAPVFSPPGPMLVVVVYESSEMPLPTQTYDARPKIEEAGHEFRVVDDDVEDGDGQMPDELKLAIPAAREHGLPALVVQSGDEILKVLDLPETAEEIIKEST